MKLPQYLSSSIQNTKCNTLHCNNDSLISIHQSRNSNSLSKDSRVQKLYTHQLSQCVEKLIPSLHGIFSTEQSLQNAKNYIKHFRCSNGSLNYNPIKIHKHTETMEHIGDVKRNKMNLNHSRQLHSMCQLDFGKLNNKISHHNKDNNVKEYSVTNGNNNDKSNEYDNYLSEPLSQRNKTGMLLKKLNIQESKVNSKKVHFAIDNNNTKNSHNNNNKDYAKTTRSPSPQSIFKNKSISNLLERKYSYTNKENVNTNNNSNNTNDIFRNSSPVNVSLFNGIILTIVKDGISIRNYKCENALLELNQQLKADKIFLNGIPLQFNIEDNKIMKKDTKCIKTNKSKFCVEHLQSFKIKSTKIKTITHINSIQREISLDFESVKSYDKDSPLNEDTPVHCPMQSIAPSVTSFNRHHFFNHSCQEALEFENSFGLNKNEPVNKMNNNVNVVYSKPSFTNNKFPNTKQSKSPRARNGSITIRKPKIILFDSSECRINGME